MKNIIQQIKNFTYSQGVNLIVGVVASIIAATIWQIVWQDEKTTFLLGIIVGIISFVVLWALSKQPWFLTWLTWLKSTRNAAPPLGRGKEIRRLISRIKARESSAIVGFFGRERTEVLNHLRDHQFYDEHLIFSFLDISTLAEKDTPTQFWTAILKPLERKLSAIKDTKLSACYDNCQVSHFNNESLDKLFSQLVRVNWCLVLLLDRFHELLHKPKLNNVNFLGLLRSWSSRAQNSLCLVVSVNGSLRKLHQDFLRELNAVTSPFLNFLEVSQITLVGLSETEIDGLLRNYHFRENEAHIFIKQTVGHHPYLLRIVANRLKMAYANREREPIAIAKKDFCDRMDEMLSMALVAWSQRMCQAFMLVAQQKYSELTDFSEELRELEIQGLITATQNDSWQIFSPVVAELLKDQTFDTECRKKNRYTNK
jgi:hypothetical protein